jgi:hypothetical protein
MSWVVATDYPIFTAGVRPHKTGTLREGLCGGTIEGMRVKARICDAGRRASGCPPPRDDTALGCARPAP